MKELIDWKKAQKEFQLIGEEVEKLESDYRERRQALEHLYADAHQALRDAYKVLEKLKLEECDEGPGKLRPRDRAKGRR